MSTDRDEPGVEPGGTTRSAATRKHGGRMRPLLLATAAVVVLAADIATKAAAVARLSSENPVELLGGGLYLVLYRNSGAAFSLADEFTWLLSLIGIAVVGTVIGFARRVRSRAWALGLGLILGGAAGNLTDRLVRPPGPLQGHVIDFLSLFAPDGSVWPVFNIADAAIVSGGVLLVVLTLTGREYDKGQRSVS